MRRAVLHIYLALTRALLFSKANAACIDGSGWSFHLKTEYNVNDVGGVDVQCDFSTVKDAFVDQVFNSDDFVLKDEDCTNSAEQEFLEQLGVDTKDDGVVAVSTLCSSAQDKLRRM